MNIDSTQISERIDKFDRFHTLYISSREPTGSIKGELDKFVHVQSNKQAGITFTGLGRNWHELTRPDAQYVLQYILSHDIAFGSPEIPESDAVEIVNDFLASFNGDCRYFSNGMFNEHDNSWSGHGVTNATFETGVVVVSSTLIGILWCHDED